MGDFALVLRRGGERDIDVIISLIDAAAGWLRTKNTDQWAQPWPSEEDRSHRILRDLRARKTWIAWDGALPAATITADSQANPIWPAETRRERAVYVCRLVVSRAHAGRSLGAGLLDWVGFRAMRRYDARWVRVDVWTTNSALHDYYERQGFEFYGFCDAMAEYPSAALFQKATDRIKPTDGTLFQLASPEGWRRGLAPRASSEG
jgi:GNAT superfamily N-acetyltransferase